MKTIEIVYLVICGVALIFGTGVFVWGLIELMKARKAVREIIDRMNGEG